LPHSDVPSSMGTLLDMVGESPHSTGRPTGACCTFQLLGCRGPGGPGGFQVPGSGRWLSVSLLDPLPTGRGSEPHPVGELQSSLGFWGTVKKWFGVKFY
jgi:hypothetical protein